MSCSVCNGHAGCPCCSPEPKTSPCQECDGTGYTFFDSNGYIVSAEHYNQLPPNKREKEPCDYCDGTGKIECDDELDYDDYDE